MQSKRRKAVSSDSAKKRKSSHIALESSHGKQDCSSSSESVVEILNPHKPNTTNHQGRKTNLIHGVLISISKEDRMASIEALCDELKSQKWVTNVNDSHFGIIPALCKQLKYSLMEGTDVTEEMSKICEALEMVHRFHGDLSKSSFPKYGDVILSSSIEVVNRCIATNDDTNTVIISTMTSVSSMLLHCSRFKCPTSRKIMANFNGLILVLRNTLNGSWPRDTIRTPIMGAIANNPIDKVSMEEVVRFPALLDSVVEILCTESGKLKEFALALILNLTNAASCVKVMSGKGKLMKSVAKILNDDNVDTLKHSLTVLERVLKLGENYAIVLEKNALDDLLLMLEKRNEKRDKMMQHLITRSLKILHQLARGVSVVVMAAKTGIMQKIASVALSNSSGEEIRKLSVAIFSCFALSLKSPAETNYNELITSLLDLMSLRAHVDKIIWLLLYQAALDSETQLHIISIDGFLGILSQTILDDDVSEMARVRASSILLNFSANKRCHKRMVKNGSLLSSIVKASKKDTKNDEDGEARVLLVRTVINLALNKANTKKLTKNSGILPLLADVSTPRNKAFVGARDAIFILLQ